jgi:uncharacterized protein
MIKHVIVKVSGACNLGCTYCYYMTDRPTSAKVPMSLAVMEATLAGLADYLDQCEPGDRAVNIHWHGGEPLLRKPAFWHAVHEAETRLSSVHGVRWGNIMTTNAVLLSDEMVDFLAGNRWIVQISIDGPRPRHDRYRLDLRGNGTYDRVIEGYLRLRQAGLEPVVHSVLGEEEGSGRALYEHHKRLGVTACQIHLPFYSWLSEPDADRRSAGLLRELLAVHELWQGDGQTMRIRTFDSVLRMLRRGEAISCHHKDICNEVITIEPSGDVFLCDDLLGLDMNEARLGLSVLSSDFNRVADEVDQRIAAAGHFNKAEECAKCEIYDLCRGGCPATRWDGHTYANRSAHCAVFKGTYSKIKETYEADNSVGALLASFFQSDGQEQAGLTPTAGGSLL